MKQNKYILELKNVSKYINGEPIFTNINLKIKKTEIISIIGESGIGKTTLLKCINKLLDLDNGNIIFDGKNINKIDKMELRTKIGLVFQEYNLFENLNVLDNLVLGQVKVKGVNETNAIHRANSILKYMKLEKKKYNFSSELSGGEKQRVAIARTLLMEPSIILLDEPTSSLDKETKKDIIKLIKKMQEKNYTIIVVSHEEYFVNKISDKIYKITNQSLEQIK